MAVIHARDFRDAHVGRVQLADAVLLFFVVSKPQTESTVTNLAGDGFAQTQGDMVPPFFSTSRSNCSRTCWRKIIARCTCRSESWPVAARRSRFAFCSGETAINSRILSMPPLLTATRSKKRASLSGSGQLQSFAGSGCCTTFFPRGLHWRRHKKIAGADIWNSAARSWTFAPAFNRPRIVSRTSSENICVMLLSTTQKNCILSRGPVASRAFFFPEEAAAPECTRQTPPRFHAREECPRLLFSRMRGMRETLLTRGDDIPGAVRLFNVELAGIRAQKQTARTRAHTAGIQIAAIRDCVGIADAE